MNEKNKNKNKDYFGIVLFVLFVICIFISVQLLILYFDIPIIFSLVISCLGWLLIFLVMLKL